MQLTKQHVVLFVCALKEKKSLGESPHQIWELEHAALTCPKETSEDQKEAMTTQTVFHCFSCGKMIGKAIEPIYHTNCYTCNGNGDIFNGFILSRMALGYSDPVINLIYNQFLHAVNKKQLDLSALRKKLKIRQNVPKEEPDALDGL